MNDSFRKSTLIGWLFLVGLSAAYLVFLIMPQSRAMRAMVTEIEQRQAAIQEGNQARLKRGRLEIELQETSAYNSQFAEQIVKPGSLPALYSRVSRIAKARNLVTSKVEPQPMVDYESLQRLSIGLGVNGSFSSIYELVRELELLPEQIWITDVKVRGPKEAGKPVECDLSLVVFTNQPEKTD